MWYVVCGMWYVAWSKIHGHCDGDERRALCLVSFLLEVEREGDVDIEIRGREQVIRP